jgi:hypothetical protein
MQAYCYHITVCWEANEPGPAVQEADELAVRQRAVYCMSSYNFWLVCDECRKVVAWEEKRMYRFIRNEVYMSCI